MIACKDSHYTFYVLVHNFEVTTCTLCYTSVHEALWWCLCFIAIAVASYSLSPSGYRQRYRHLTLTPPATFPCLYRCRLVGFTAHVIALLKLASFAEIGVFFYEPYFNIKWRMNDWVKFPRFLYHRKRPPFNAFVNVFYVYFFFRIPCVRKHAKI